MDNDESLNLLSLPETILYTILSHTSIAERTNLLLISHQFTSIVTKPDFVQERRSNSSSDEVLFLVGGRYPDRNLSGPFSRRMGLHDNFSRGIWGYVPSLKSWRMFGGDPRQMPNHPMEHVIGSKPVYLPHPHNCLVLLGGYHRLMGEAMDRVVCFSFLTGRWHIWPSMLRKRKGEAFHAVRVQNKLVVIGCSYEKCDCKKCMASTVYYDAVEVAGLDNCIGMFVDESGVDDGGGCGQCEVFDLETRKWTQCNSRAPSCPPKDGGSAALENRYIVLPGTDVQAESNESNRVSAVVSDDAGCDDGRVEGLLFEDQASSRCCSPSFVLRRPGLVYDVLEDKWTTVSSSRSSATCFPATVEFKNKVLVMGGYRSSDDSIVSLFRDGLTVDYEEHVDYCWWYSMADGVWHRGGEDGASSGSSRKTHKLPKKIPVSVRGASALIYNGCLTLLGGLTTFSETFHSEERRVIWQYNEENTGDWKPMEFDWKFGMSTQVKLPVSALLDTYAFSAHL